MPRLRIIVLDSPDVSQAARSNFRLALWADVPVARQKFYAQAQKTSQWLDATLQDNQNLQNGLVAESVVTYAPDTVRNLAQMEADAIALWTAWQNQITNTNKWPNYGSNYDGNAWTIVSVT